MLTTKSAQFAPLWISRGKRATRNPATCSLLPPTVLPIATITTSGRIAALAARPAEFIRLPAKHATFFVNFILVARNASRAIKNLEDVLETEAESACLQTHRVRDHCARAIGRRIGNDALNDLSGWVLWVVPLMVTEIALQLRKLRRTSRLSS